VADAVLEGKAMRKDEEMEAEAEAKPAGEASAVEPGAHHVELDEELEDEALLGASTLAKLTPAVKEEEAGKTVEPTTPTAEPEQTDKKE
jgi:hypothetical protein